MKNQRESDLYKTNKPDNNFLLLAFLHPLILIFIGYNLLYNEKESLHLNYVNVSLSIVSALFVLYLYLIIHKPEMHMVFKYMCVNVYATFFVWILLQGADYNNAQHRSVWMSIYINTVLIESFLFFIVYMKYND
jgi:hypothetical protein